MEDEKKDSKTYLNYGVLTGVILIVLFVLYYVFGLYTNKTLAWLPALIFMAMVIIAQVNHAKSLDGNITYGDLFAAGFKTTAAAVAIYVLFLIIFVLLVPSYKDQMMEVNRQRMVEKGLTEDQIGKGMAMGKKFFTVGLIGGTIVIDLIVGLIASLIGAAVAKKDPQPRSPRL